MLLLFCLGACKISLFILKRSKTLLQHASVSLFLIPVLEIREPFQSADQSLPLSQKHFSFYLSKYYLLSSISLYPSKISVIHILGLLDIDSKSLKFFFMISISIVFSSSVWDISCRPFSRLLILVSIWILHKKVKCYFCLIKFLL